ncbi:MAG TPA: hypothetical protein VGS15_09435 [Candidatus Acidoferrales bacterium]|nr:hypothetical protein [Candidatus Acidoferrales bacterium]
MKKRILLGAATVVAALIAAYFLLPSHTPPPQPPMETLSAENFSDFLGAFNNDTSETRLVLLLSPT